MAEALSWVNAQMFQIFLQISGQPGDTVRICMMGIIGNEPCSPRAKAANTKRQNHCLAQSTAQQTK